MYWGAYLERGGKAVNGRAVLVVHANVGAADGADAVGGLAKLPGNQLADDAAVGRGANVVGEHLLLHLLKPQDAQRHVRGAIATTTAS